MGRFAYIPINFENLDIGLEREVLIKRDTDDLYVLDDFKVPVTVTKKIREMTADLPDNLDPWHNKMIELNSKFTDIKLKCQEYEKELDSYMDLAQNTFYKRLEALKDYVEWLKNLFNEIKRYHETNNTQLSKILNEYNTDLDKILMMVENRYEENVTYFNKYKYWKNGYDDLLSKLEEDISKIKSELEKKMLLFGTFIIIVNSNNEPVPTDCAIKIWCGQNWLSNPNYGNSPYKYPGNLTLTGQKGVWSYSDPPILQNADFINLLVEGDTATRWYSGDGKYDFFVTDGNDEAFSEEIATLVGTSPNTARHIDKFVEAFQNGLLERVGGDETIVMTGWGRGNFYPASDCPSEVLSDNWDGSRGGHGGHSIGGQTDYRSKFSDSPNGIAADYVYIEGHSVSFGNGRVNTIACPTHYYIPYKIKGVAVTQPNGSANF